METALFLF